MWRQKISQDLGIISDNYKPLTLLNLSCYVLAAAIEVTLLYKHSVGIQIK